MTDSDILNEIAGQFGPEADVATGKWFGRPCLKVGGKVFAALWDGDMTFKLSGDEHAEALAVAGAHLFDPRGQGHPMKEWVQIPAAQSATWPRYAALARDYVAGAAQAHKDRLIGGLVEARVNLLAAARALTPAQRETVFLGEWSVKDLLAHLAGWDRTYIVAVGEILAGQKPAFWGHYDRDWATFNARLVDEYGQGSFSDVLRAVEESQRALIAYLQSVPAEEFVKRKQIETLLRVDVKDGIEHRDQIVAFAGGG